MSCRPADDLTSRPVVFLLLDGVGGCCRCVREPPVAGALRRLWRSLADRDLFWHLPHYWWGDHDRAWIIVRSGDWKLIRFYEDGRVELYNVAGDEGEARDLAGRRPDLVEDLGRRLDAWLLETGAKLPLQNCCLGLRDLDAGRLRPAERTSRGRPEDSGGRE
jgi:hypothetical protein